MSQIRFKALFKSFFRFAGVIFSLYSISACTENGPKDTIAAYELMRKKTGQEHSHVEYCENNTVRLTISGRGELNTRDIYVPRKAVVHFRNRDDLNKYPLGVRIADDCLSRNASNDCREGSKVWGINISLLDTAERLLQSAFDYHRMEPSSQRVAELYVMQVKEAARTDDNHRKDDLIYTNFSPAELLGDRNLPTLYIKYDSNIFFKPERKRCSWSFYTNEAIRTSHASHCDDLSEWKTYLSDFDALSDQISKHGEFARNCAL